MNIVKIVYLPRNGNDILALSEEPSEGYLTGCYIFTVFLRDSPEHFRESNDRWEVLL